MIFRTAKPSCLKPATRLLSALTLTLLPLTSLLADPLKIMPVGDSITEGFEACSYRKPLVESLASCNIEMRGDQNGAYYPGHTCLTENTTHMGYGGWQTTDFLASDGSGESRLEGYISDHQPDVVLLHIGSNDMYYAEDPGVYNAVNLSGSGTIGNINTMLNQIYTRQPGATVLVANLIPWYGEAYVSDGLDLLRAEIEKMVSARASAGDALAMVDVHSGFNANMVHDGVHPNASGESHIAARFKNALQARGFCNGTGNLPPSLQAIADQQDTVGDSVSVQLAATDPNGDALTYSVSGLPAGITLDSNTGLISGSANSAFNSTVTVVVSDGSLTDSRQFNWTISDGNSNQSPVLQILGDQQGRVNDTVSLQLSASDPNGDNLSYSAIGLPAGLSVNQDNGLISGILTTEQTANVSISVSDGSLSDSEQFVWTVNQSDITDPELTDNEPVSGNVSQNDWMFYTIEAGADVIRVTVRLTGLSGDADLYVRAGQRPSGDEISGGQFDCKSTNGGTTNEQCRLDNNSATTWHIGVHGYSTANYQLAAELETAAVNNDTPISSDQSIEDSVFQGDWQFYKIDATAADTELTVDLSGLSADIDLYVRQGSRPSGHSQENGIYDCLSTHGGNSNERCVVSNESDSSWYIGVHGYSSGSFTVTARLSQGSIGGDPTALALDNTATGQIGLREWKFYSVDVPQDSTRLDVKLQDLTNDADLYVRETTRPSGTVDEGGQYDCGSYNGGTTTEVCELNNAGGKRYIVGVYGYQASDYSLLATASTEQIVITELVSGQSDSTFVNQGDWTYYKIKVPASDSRLTVNLTGMSSDGDLFVRQGQIPSSNANAGADSDCYSVKGGTQNESCTLENNATTEWYIGVYGYQATAFTVNAQSSSTSRLAAAKSIRVGKGESLKSSGSTGNESNHSTSGGGGALAWHTLLLIALVVSRRRFRG